MYSARAAARDRMRVTTAEGSPACFFVTRLKPLEFGQRDEMDVTLQNLHTALWPPRFRKM
eukprot:13905788-Heterocapsa_arctica.AAC.1